MTTPSLAFVRVKATAEDEPPQKDGRSWKRFGDRGREMIEGGLAESGRCSRLVWLCVLICVWVCVSVWNEEEVGGCERMIETSNQWGCSEQKAAEAAACCFAVEAAGFSFSSLLVRGSMYEWSVSRRIWRRRTRLLNPLCDNLCPPAPPARGGDTKSSRCTSK